MSVFRRSLRHRVPVKRLRGRSEASETSAMHLTLVHCTVVPLLSESEASEIQWGLTEEVHDITGEILK